MSTANPLRTFTRDQVVEKVNDTATYARYYIKVVNGTWIQVPLAYIRRYLDASVRSEVKYELDAIHERGIGYGLYITPLDADAPFLTPAEKTVALGQEYSLGAKNFEKAALEADAWRDQNPQVAPIVTAAEQEAALRENLKDVKPADRVVMPSNAELAE